MRTKIPTNPHGRHRHAAGFTLMEAVFAIMIVGLGVVAMMHLFAAGTEVNATGNDVATGTFLAQQIRAFTDNVEYPYLYAYDGGAWYGVDAEGNPISGLQQFTQALSVEAVNPDDLTTYVGSDPQLIRLTVTVTQDNQQVARIAWLRAP